MAEVGISIKIMPEGTDVDLDQLRERVLAAVPNNVKVSDVAVVPVAFGLKALVIDFITGDESPLPQWMVCRGQKSKKLGDYFNSHFIMAICPHIRFSASSNITD